MMTELADFIQREKDFSANAFGNQSNLGIIKHIRKEMLEVEDSPEDVFEWVDIILLAIDGALRAGYSSVEVAIALEEKLSINEAREWGPIVEGEPIEHIRDGE